MRRRIRLHHLQKRQLPHATGSPAAGTPAAACARSAAPAPAPAPARRSPAPSAPSAPAPAPPRCPSRTNRLIASSDGSSTPICSGVLCRLNVWITFCRCGEGILCAIKFCAPSCRIDTFPAPASACRGFTTNASSSRYTTTDRTCASSGRNDSTPISTECISTSSAIRLASARCTATLIRGFCRRNSSSSGSR